MPTASVELHEVTKENWQECIKLELKSEQRDFVSSNLYSLAQSKFEPQRIPCAIYDTENTMVGFIMYNDKPLDDGSYRISRLMIDQAQQGKGYGRAAAQQAIARLQKVPDCKEIVLDYVENNQAAEQLWTSLGFEVFDQNKQYLMARLKL